MRKVWYMIIIILITGCFFQSTHIRYTNKSISVQEKVSRELAHEVVRFHVRANSNSVEDQKLKMQVKSQVLAFLQPRLDKVNSVQGAKDFLEGTLDSIYQVADRVVKEEGYNYKVNVSVTEENFPQKVYGDCTFPAGRYPALVIYLGNGTGHNWWCMLYPGLCFVDESYAIVPEEKKEQLKEVLSEDAYEWIVNPEHRKITVRWEWLRKVLEFTL